MNTHAFQLILYKLEKTLAFSNLSKMSINPQNPLDDFYSPDSLKEYLEFAKRYNLHVIIDEIYRLSVLDEHENVLGMESLSDLNNTHVINQSAPIRISASLALA